LLERYYEWEEFILNAFVYLEPVQRSEDGCDMRSENMKMKYEDMEI